MTNQPEHRFQFVEDAGKTESSPLIAGNCLAALKLEDYRRLAPQVPIKGVDIENMLVDLRPLSRIDTTMRPDILADRIAEGLSRQTYLPDEARDHIDKYLKQAWNRETDDKVFTVDGAIKALQTELRIRGVTLNLKDSKVDLPGARSFDIFKGEDKSGGAIISWCPDLTETQLVDGLSSLLNKRNLSEKDNETLDAILEQMHKSKVKFEDIFKKANAKHHALSPGKDVTEEIRLVGYKNDTDRKVITYTLKITSPDGKEQCFDWHPSGFSPREGR